MPGAEGELKVAAPKPTKLELFNAALAAADGAPDTQAATPKKKKVQAKKAAASDKAEKADVADKPSDDVEPAEVVEQAESAESASES